MRDGQDVSLGVQNRLFAALLNHWNLKRPNVLCHDIGAATALRAHLLNGCDYTKMLMFDAVAIRPWGSPFVQHVRQHETAFVSRSSTTHGDALGFGRTQGGVRHEKLLLVSH
jgi:pimeloyl-ACP methyl ester carboxylesterase